MLVNKAKKKTTVFGKVLLGLVVLVLLEYLKEEEREKKKRTLNVP